MRPAFTTIRSGLLWGLTAFVLLATLVVLASAIWSPAVGLGAGIAALLTALPIAALAAGSRALIAVLTAGLLAIGGGFLAGDRMQQVTAAVTGRFAEGVSPADAVSLNGATMFRFRDARIARELAGHGSSRTRRIGKGTVIADSAVSVAPLIDRGWTHDQTVRVWSVCKARFDRAPCPGWSADWTGGALILPNSAYGDYQTTIEEIATRHRLHLAPEGLILVRLAADPPATLAELADGVIQPLAFFLAVWCAGFAIFHLLSAWRTRQSVIEGRKSAALEARDIQPQPIAPSVAAQVAAEPGSAPPPRLEDVQVDKSMVSGRLLPFRWTLRQGRNVVCEVDRDHVSFEISINPSYPEVLETYTFREFWGSGSDQVRDALGQPVLDQVAETIAAWQAAPPPHREVREGKERMRQSEQQRKRVRDAAARKISVRKNTEP